MCNLAEITRNETVWRMRTNNVKGVYCSKNLNIFLCLLPNKMFVLRAGTHKMVVKKANREDQDQTASSEAV